MSRTGLDFALTRTGITVHERLVLVALCYKLSDRLGDYTITTSIDSLANLLEICPERIKKTLLSLQKKGLIAKTIIRRWSSVRNTTSFKYKITIAVVNPYIEDRMLERADRETQHKINLFDQLLAIYPVEENRDRAWKVFAALNPDEKLFFEIVNDLYGRIRGELPPLSGLQLSSYLSRKMWVKHSAH